MHERTLLSQQYVQLSAQTLLQAFPAPRPQVALCQQARPVSAINMSPLPSLSKHWFLVQMATVIFAHFGASAVALVLRYQCRPQPACNPCPAAALPRINRQAPPVENGDIPRKNRVEYLSRSCMLGKSLERVMLAGFQGSVGGARIHRSFSSWGSKLLHVAWFLHGAMFASLVSWSPCKNMF